jgi:hypothetical protein
MKDNGFGLDFTIFNVNFVATKNNWDIFTNSDQISVPIWNIFVGDTRGYIKHDDSTLALQDKLTSVETM